MKDGQNRPSLSMVDGASLKALHDVFVFWFLIPTMVKEETEAGILHIRSSIAKCHACNICLLIEVDGDDACGYGTSSRRVWWMLCEA